MSEFLGGNSIAGVGCPSFGGQRTGRGDSSRIQVSLGTCRWPQQHATVAGIALLGHRRWYSVAISAKASLQRFAKAVEFLRLVRPAGVIAFVMQVSCSANARLTYLPGMKYMSVVASRSRHLGALAALPNRSVKGTGLRPAPYVER